MLTVDRQMGTPQGEPLSSLLANVLLDEVDKALEARGCSFARYADVVMADSVQSLSNSCRC